MALPLQMAREGAQGRQLAHQRTALHRLQAPGGQEGADVEGLEPQDRRDARRLAEMAGQEGRNCRRSRPYASTVLAESRRSLAREASHCIASRRVSAAPGKNEIQGIVRIVA